MRVLQYCYFALRSESMSADEMTQRLAVEADEVGVLGSRRTEPFPVPRCHTWRVVAREPGAVDDQVAQLVTRLTPASDRIAALVDGCPVSATLQVVRYFGDPDGVQHGGRGNDQDHLQDLTGQRRSLGWHLDLATLEFLRAVRAELDVDEYDMGDDG